MGYYTRYGLTWEPHEPEVEIYIKAQEEKYYGVTPEGEGTEACKWYEHEECMLELSKAFPKLTFVLSGEGEEQGDVWQKKFINGEQWTSRAKLVFSAFEKGNLNHREGIEWPI